MNVNCNEKLEKWKALAIEPTTLIVGIDISKNKHNACFGKRDHVIDPNFEFDNTFVGFNDLIIKIKVLVLSQRGCIGDH